MTIVGLDTSLPVTSVCVLREEGGKAFCTAQPDEARLLGPARHSAELLPELDRLIRESGTEWRDVRTIAVGVGPGTFTGLRIGVSTARALGQALSVQLRPVSSLEALAAGLAEGAAVPADRPLLALTDARRGQVFVAAYRAEAAASPSTSGGGPPRLDRLREPAVMEPAAILQLARELGPAPLCAGDWAIRSRRELEGAGCEVPTSESGLHAVNALYVCRIATEVDPVAPERVLPVYMRMPDAEISRRAKEQGR